MIRDHTEQEYKLEQCEELWRVDCGNRTELEPPIATAHCPRAWGTFADEEDECGVFWKCQDGKANRCCALIGLQLSHAALSLVRV